MKTINLIGAGGRGQAVLSSLSCRTKAKNRTAAPTQMAESATLNAGQWAVPI
jgi:hypothetical protein